MTSEVINIVLEAAYLLSLVAIVVAVVQQRGEPTKTLAWVLFIALAPFVGIVFYLTLGRSYRRRKKLSRKLYSDNKNLMSLIEHVATANDYRSWFGQRLPEADFCGIARMLERSNKTLPTRYNRVNLLLNASEKYKMLFDAIDSAQHHVHIDYYGIADDVVGNRLREHLIGAAQRGVQVRLIYDGIGSWGLGKFFLRSMREAGVQAFPFLPVKIQLFKSKINYRNHRKIAVIDGSTGFVGGINIADRYLQGLPEIGIWRDTHVMLQGDSVQWLQMIFLLDWLFVSNQTFGNVERLFPPHCITEQHSVQIAASGPDSDWASIMQTYFAAINRARKRLYIATPYFVPNESLLTAICTAALRGVDVRLLISERSDSSVTQWASVSYFDTLLDAGVSVYLYSKGFNHSKILVADGEFCSIGTANMDVRSFEHDFEVNALFYDEAFAEQIESMFEHDLQYSHRLTLEQWHARPRRERFMENVSRLLAPML